MGAVSGQKWRGWLGGGGVRSLAFGIVQEKESPVTRAGSFHVVWLRSLALRWCNLQHSLPSGYLLGAEL